MVKIKGYIVGFIFLVALSFILPAHVFAADLIFTPSSVSIAKDQTLSISVALANNNQAINAVSGTLSFPADILAVQSISKDNSFVKFWTSDPTFSNAAGSISFEGVIFNPGFSDSSGTVITIHFVAKKSETGTVSFSAGSV